MCKHDDGCNIPKEIADAARKVTQFFAEQNMHNWVIDGCVSRSADDPATLNQIPAVKALREENERLSRERDMFEQSVAHWKKAYREDTETLRDSKECALAQLHEVTQATKNLCFMAQTTGGGPDAKLIEAINTVANKLELASVAEAHRQFEGQRERIAELEANAMKHAANVIGFFQKIEALESQLAELRQGGEAFGIVQECDVEPDEDGDYEVVILSQSRIAPGEPLYTRPQPAIPPGYVVVKSELFEAVAALVRFAGDWNQGTHAKLYRPVICRLVGEHIASAPAIQPQAASVPVAAPDAKDAARYRWLCDPKVKAKEGEPYIVYMGEGIDEAIDAAMQSISGGDHE